MITKSDLNSSTLPDPLGIETHAVIPCALDILLMRNGERTVGIFCSSVTTTYNGILTDVKICCVLPHQNNH